MPYVQETQEPIRDRIVEFLTTLQEPHILRPSSVHRSVYVGEELL